MRRNDDSTALQNKLRSRHHQEATKVEGDQGTPGEEIWSQK